jgi:signal transduction histidine kinase
MGTQHKGLKTWRGDVKDYARATLKAEALAVELEEQVGRTNGVVKALDDLSLNTPTSETDAASVLKQFAEFVQPGLPDGATLRVDAPRPCIVGIPRQTVIGLLCNAIESAIYNMMAAVSARRISLRACVLDPKTVVVEIADDGAPASALFHAGAKDPSFSDSRAIWLRHVRKRARRAGGEMTVTSDAAGNVLSLYLPLAPGTTACPHLDETLRARPPRRRRIGPRDEGASAAGKPGRALEPRNS